ncbi:MAG: UTP--glucose-1-phosphate uridylyltransferase [Candidatus Krumholzibacteria bacterium]|nr:UTP--glucose-1-phosphate uridylyltransferase [Candidatus Krumholzibacteria bacterium]
MAASSGNFAAADFAPVAERMGAADLPDIVIRTFQHYYAQLAAGQTGLIPEADIQPVAEVPGLDDITAEHVQIGTKALSHSILLKLNGGLGTGMGLAKAKSLLTVKEGHTFLDIIAQQASLGGIPLVLMNSFSTRDDTLAALTRYPELGQQIPLDFLQHKVPKLRATDLSPADWPADPELTWCPPGHGDIYTALVTSGMLDQLLDAGYRTAFVSNSDNLGAVMDPAILGYFVGENLPFLMEVADRTEADKKGGHLAQSPTGQLLLRESAQCPPQDSEQFQDITRHRFFNTNNLWLNLPVLRELLDRQDGILGLPMIRNAKTVDPRDKNSTPVFQLETAMGSAIGIFAGAGALRIDHSRFAPIKKTNDLLDVRSDNYILTEDFQVRANPQRQLERVVIDLDPRHYGFIDQLDEHFPHGAPSLLGCERLTVQGDIYFGRDVVLTGVVEMHNDGTTPLSVPDGALITGTWTG